jgi:oligopeptide/dipeptide ABC transporter ATP-binding protein
MLLEIDDVHVRFPGRGLGLPGRRRQVHAVSGVDLTVARGDSLGIVGESGSGKTTLARAVCGLVPVTSGTIRLDGQVLPPRRDASASRRIQLVFQDPTSSLNPRMRGGTMLRELLRVHRLADGAAARRRSVELLELVGLPASAADCLPRQLSGGQRQRVGIARALAVEPQVLVADEAVSALDAATTAMIVELLRTLRGELGLTMVFISHDLDVVRAACDRVAVMYAGRIVESGKAEDLYANPRHPYTRALLAAVPRLDSPRRPGTAGLAGEPPSVTQQPAGCAFQPRCPIAVEECATIRPILQGERRGAVACHRGLTEICGTADAHQARHS